MKEAVTVTESARAFISSACGEGKLMRVRINNKGCSGHSYEYTIIDRGASSRFDEIVEWEGGGLVIDAASVLHLLGSTLDVKGTIFERQLSWQNPHAADPCGCGVSFSLKG